ncbi:MAG: type III-B CRISPR-associated protein Cas10/Cmr2 [Ignavibacteria bacterium]|nr:type III-B CRISPR-associated protein Cas10/Cmr2 [Ignavibacteria bacterium]
MNNYLFLFTISPVQSFIAQARKTRDLYNSSRILSDLIEFAISQINPKEIIFPFFDKQTNDKEKSYPNRFIAILEGNDDQDVKNLGHKFKNQILKKFEEFSINAVKEAKIYKEKLPANFYNQIKNHLLIHWVALPFSDEQYKKRYKEIESLLGAIKNVREFEQVEETGRKCSICGERNMIFCQKGNKSKFQLKPNWKLLSTQEKITIEDFNNSIIEVNYPFDSSEGLCAVCFTKRFYLIEEFPSTAHIALKHLDSNEKTKKQIDYMKNIFDDYFDYQLLYEENLKKAYFKKQNIQVKLLEEAKPIQAQLKKIAKEENLKITPYYSVVMFDGDSMGKWLSGSNLREDVNLLDFHKKLTQLLNEFAYETRNIVTEEKGKVVYAGGEDFLAFINLNYLFDVLRELRIKFDDIINNGISEFKNENKNLTFSAGIIIAHYKWPLSEVLSWARKLEKEAKDIDDDKNAFAIAVMKHSGEINKAILKWGMNGTENIDTLANITYDLSHEIFSNSFINQLSKEFYGLTLRSEILKTELERLLIRSFKPQRKINESKEQFIKRKLEKIHNTMGCIISLYEKLNLENLISALFIAEFISRHLNGVKNEN